MSKTIFAKDLLSEAERLFAESKHPTQDFSSLATKVIQLGEQLRAAQQQGGIIITDKDYHRAARIYTEELLYAFIDHLRLEESNPIWYNRSLAEL